MVAPREIRGGQSNRGGQGGQCGRSIFSYYDRMGYTQEKCYSLMVFQIKLLMCLSMKVRNLEFLIKSTKIFLDTSLRNLPILTNPLQCQMCQLHASLNLWKFIVHGFLIQVPQIMSLVTFHHFPPKEFYIS